MTHEGGVSYRGERGVTYRGGHSSLLDPEQGGVSGLYKSKRQLTPPLSKSELTPPGPWEVRPRLNLSHALSHPGLPGQMSLAVAAGGFELVLPETVSEVPGVEVTGVLELPGMGMP